MKETDLIEIVRLENRNPTGFVSTIYKKPDGNYIKKGEYKGQVEWIEMRHGAEFYDKDQDWTFQEVFHVSEAIEHGFEVPCNYDKYIDPYKKLTCAPNKLILLKELSYEGFSSNNYRLNELYECPSCHQVWQLNKEMDSHRGMAITCYKVDRDT